MQITLQQSWNQFWGVRGYARSWGGGKNIWPLGKSSAECKVSLKYPDKYLSSYCLETARERELTTMLDSWLHCWLLLLQFPPTSSSLAGFILPVIEIHYCESLSSAAQKNSSLPSYLMAFQIHKGSDRGLPHNCLFFRLNVPMSLSFSTWSWSPGPWSSYFSQRTLKQMIQCEIVALELIKNSGHCTPWRFSRKELRFQT